MTSENSSLPDAVLVVCLCAQWCGVCGDYRARFAQVQAKFPQATFLWVDVEDEADLLYPMDIENFPTLLLVVGGKPRFFGPLTPQVELLERLVRAQVQGSAGAALGDPELLALVAKILATLPDRPGFYT